jgi:hypothetical protein
VIDRNLVAHRRVPPIATVIAIQGVVALLTFAALVSFGRPVSQWTVAAGAGLLAALLTRLAGLEIWWVIIQLLFPGLVLAATLSGWPAWVYLALFLALALVYWSTLRSRVPLYLSNAATWHAVATLLPAPQVGRSLRFADLGSGLGGLLCHLAASRPDIEFEGLELAPLPVWLSRVRVALAGRSNVRIRWGSFWSRDLADFDVVFAFLSPVPMADLFAKVQREMLPGTLFISCAFEVPGATPDQVIDLPSPRQPRLLVWQIAAKN